MAKMKPLLFPLTFTIKKTSSCVYFLGPGGPWFENHLVSSKLNVNKPHTSSDNCEAMNPFHDKDPSLKQLPGVKLLLGAPNQQMWPKISITTSKSLLMLFLSCNYPSSCVACLHLVCLKQSNFQPQLAPAGQNCTHDAMCFIEKV